MRRKLTIRKENEEERKLLQKSVNEFKRLVEGVK